jgi:GNAT superfamily N-acetyltransferase
VAPRIVPAADVADLDERWDAVGAGAWPEYNTHGDVLNRYWGRLGDEFAPFQFALFDDADELLARGSTIPCRWDGTLDGLPRGIDGVIEDGFALRERGERANALSALAIVVRPDLQGRGLSPTMVEAMRSLAREHGLRALIAPVRPRWKDRYPLVPIERYAAWTREDGLPFDPWLRLHVRLGGRILRPEPRSLRITGSVADWEEWTSMAFPETGEYVFPQGLATLAIDREKDVGRYWEPNVWTEHPVERAPD